MQMKQLFKAVSFLFVAVAALPQASGLYAELISKGIAALEGTSYNEAINLLEEAWEKDKTNPIVAEYLAMGYLYADADAKRYMDLAENSIVHGGVASFLVQHFHNPKTPLLSGELAEYCNGRLSISAGRLAFASKTVPEHSLTILQGQLKDIKDNRIYGTVRGMYRIRTTDKKVYDFRPRAWSPEEGRLIVTLAHRYVK
jgi:hypothetical protein